MNKLKIGENQQAEKEFKARMNEKVLAFTTIKQEAEKHNLKYDVDKLYSNPEKEFDNAIDRTFNTGVLKQLSTRKRKELFEINTNILGKAIAVYNRHTDLDFNPETFEFDTPNFDILIEGEERILDYNKVSKLIQLIEEVEPEYIAIRVQQALKNKVLLNARTNKLEVNISRLKG